MVICTKLKDRNIWSMKKYQIEYLNWLANIVKMLKIFKIRVRKHIKPAQKYINGKHANLCIITVDG